MIISFQLGSNDYSVCEYKVAPDGDEAKPAVGLALPVEVAEEPYKYSLKRKSLFYVLLIWRLLSVNPQ